MSDFRGYVLHPAPDDSELVERARGGDLDAYGELVARHQDQALAAAYIILGNRQEAEDASQEAFTRAFAALHRFRPGARFRPWLLRIVVNEAHDLRTARRRRADILARASGQVESTTGSQSAESAALNQSRRKALLESLFSLPELDRLVITCRYFLDLSEAETADVLGIARGTVKSRVSRALARLRPILRDLGPLVFVGPLVEPIIDEALRELGHAGLLQPGANLSHAVLATLGGPSTHGSVAAVVKQLRQHAGQVAVAVGVLIVGGTAMLGGTRSPPSPQPPSGTSASPAAPSIVVFGGDVSDADERELTTYFGSTQADGTETVPRQELVQALQAQGISVSATDEAMSSIRLVCGQTSGLQVQTHNITGVAAPTYAAALLTAGLADVTAQVAAPSEKPVSGETALVGIFKAYPTCSAGSAPDPERVRLAYEQLKVTRTLASDGADLTHASAIVLDVLQTVVTRRAEDDQTLAAAIDSAAAQEDVSVGAAARSELEALFRQLRRLDYGSYSRGFEITQLEPDNVRIAQ